MIRLSNKLDYTKLVLFKIRKILGLINCKLDLLIKMRIYLSFYILILKLINPETLVWINLLGIDPSNQTLKNKVEAILKGRLINKKN